MYRYFALVWSTSDRQAACFAEAAAERLQSGVMRWARVLTRKEMLVLHAGPRPGRFQAYELPPYGVVLGKLFQSSMDEPTTRAELMFDEVQSQRVLDSGCRYLVERYWGRYIAFLSGPDGKSYVLRDPTGSTQCFFVRLHNVTMFFSHLEDCRRVWPGTFSINWSHIRTYLRFSRLVSDETGFDQVSQLRAGECAELTDGGLKRFFCWHPAPFVMSDPVEDHARAAFQLRKVTQLCVQSWASCYQSVVHELSGGLDSSIVLASLIEAAERPRVTCFNLFTETPEADERVFARAMARRAHCELVETPLRPTVCSIDELVAAENLPTPLLATLRTESEHERQKLVLSTCSDAIFSGQGGDHLFHRRRTALVAAEYMQRRGCDGALTKVLLDTARLTGQPVTSIFSAALRYGLLKRAFNPYGRLADASFFAREKGEERLLMQRIIHPWVADATMVPAAKKQQIADLVDCQIFYAGFCDYADIVHPLISQPLVELVLNIPTYILTQSGRERALARRAFSNDLPSQVIARTDKGHASRYFNELIVHNLRPIRSLLLDGLLVRERLLCRKQLELALSENRLREQREDPWILTSLVAETFLQSAMRSGQTRQ